MYFDLLSQAWKCLIVMAVIPTVMQVMFDVVLPTLPTAPPILSVTVKAYVLENDLADELSTLQAPEGVTIGSYPFDEAGNIKGTNLVARSRDVQKLGIVRDQLQALVDSKSKS